MPKEERKKKRGKRKRGKKGKRQEQKTQKSRKPASLLIFITADCAYQLEKEKARLLAMAPSSPPDSERAAATTTSQEPPQASQPQAISSLDDEPSLEADDSAAADELESLDGSASSFGSTSIRSSVFDYEYANGRRYNGFRKGSYLLPNDDEEQDRLDLLHHTHRLLLDGALLAAPVPTSPKRVLDIGTGTGLWAIDMADEHPNAEVVGIDLSPMQPSWVPPNLRFYIDDAEDEWTFGPDEAFDIIHCRALAGSIANWPRLFAHCYAHLAPAGWIEVQEPEAWIMCDENPSMDHVPFTVQWQTLCNQAGSQFGKEIRVSSAHKQRVIDAGFVDVETRLFKVSVLFFSFFFFLGSGGFFSFVLWTYIPLPVH